MSAAVISLVARAITDNSLSSSTSNQSSKFDGGILGGSNPTTYDPKNPVILFIIQAGIILTSCRLLHYPLSKACQPRVVAEIIGGIILGPSVLMRIPGFQSTIFSSESMPNLSLVADLGLILFLFLIGLEVKVDLFLSNWRLAMSVGIAGMILPFALGCAISLGLYHEFAVEVQSIKFGIFMLFIGTAISVSTHDQVLCRILSELKLMSTPVGITVLAAGVANDVVGWILLALCVALVNNGSGITSMYVLLCCIAWTLFLVYAIRPVFLWLLRRSGCLINGPSSGIMIITLLIVFASSWFTAIIGVHAVFGAFLVGLICPQENDYSVKVANKIEDLVTSIFLPLYFALSGIKTNLGLLNSRIAWTYVIGVISVAFTGKIVGGTLAAKAHGLYWRESLTIGVLMSCKGLVEVIVLNIGLQANILSPRTFTIFVVMALITTFATTPLTMKLYPREYQQRLGHLKSREVSLPGNCLQVSGIESMSRVSSSDSQIASFEKLLVCLQLEGLPSLFFLLALISGDASSSANLHQDKSQLPKILRDQDTKKSDTTNLKRPVNLHGLRLVKVEGSSFSGMQETKIEEESFTDPVVNTFRTFAQLQNFVVTGTVAGVPETAYAKTIATEAYSKLSDLILIPWINNDTCAEDENPHDDFLGSLQNEFIQKTLEMATCNVAIVINREEIRTQPGNIAGPTARNIPPVSPIREWYNHVILPFFGGTDDEMALQFVCRLAQNNNKIKVSIIHLRVKVESSPNAIPDTEIRVIDRGGGSSTKATVPGLEKDGAGDDYIPLNFREYMLKALSDRINFTEIITATPIPVCVSHIQREFSNCNKIGDLIVCGRGRHPYLAATPNYLSSGTDAVLRQTVGDVTEAFISGAVQTNLLVIQAGSGGSQIKPTASFH